MLLFTLLKFFCFWCGLFLVFIGFVKYCLCSVLAAGMRDLSSPMRDQTHKVSTTGPPGKSHRNSTFKCSKESYFQSKLSETKKKSWRKNANTLIVQWTYGVCGVRFNINKINLRASLEVKFLGPLSTQDSIF